MVDPVALVVEEPAPIVISVVEPAPITLMVDDAPVALTVSELAAILLTVEEPAPVGLTVTDGLTPGNADVNYLRLDASNDPLTGDLATTASYLAAITLTYTLSESPFSFAGNDYVGSPDVGGACHVWDAGEINVANGAVPWADVDGTTDIDVGLYDLTPLMPGVRITVYYLAGQQAAVEGFLDGALGPGNWTRDAFAISVFAGSGGSYVYAGDPTGWTVAATYTDPPTLTGAVAYASGLYADGHAEIGGALDLAGDLNMTPGQGINWGPSLPGLSDYALNGFLSTQNPVGLAAGLIFAVQDSSANPITSNLFYGAAMGVIYYGDTYYTHPLSACGDFSSRVDTGGGTVGYLNLLHTRFTFTAGAHPSDVSHVANAHHMIFDDSNEGGSPTSDVADYYGLRDDLTMPYAVGAWHGIFLKDHSAEVAGACWGIENLGATLLDGPLHPPYESSASEPSLASDELRVWRDSGSGQVFLVFNDPTTGQVKVELT